MFDGIFDEELAIELVRAPGKIPPYREQGYLPNSVFLAGDMDTNWRGLFVQRCKTKTLKERLYIIDPTRFDWDDSWGNNISCGKLREQISWELTSMESSETIIFNFSAKSKAPISLLELGLIASSGKDILINCEDGFHAKGNVQTVASRYHLNLHDTFNEMMDEYFGIYGDFEDNTL